MKSLIGLLRLWLVAALLGFGGSAALAAEQPKQLRFGLLPAEDAIEMTKQFQGIAD